MTSDRIVIPLSKYGMDGEVVLSYPGYKKTQIAEARGLAMTVKYVDGEEQVDLERGFFAGLEKASFFIESAPIPIHGYDSLLDLLDMVDRKQRGAGGKLSEEILKAVKSIIDGDTSPFAESPEAVTERSE
jgi:hypothetical protein